MDQPAVLQQQDRTPQIWTLPLDHTDQVGQHGRQRLIFGNHLKYLPAVIFKL